MIHVTQEQFDEWSKDDPTALMLLAIGRVKILTIDEFAEAADKEDGMSYVVRRVSSGSPYGEASEYRTIKCDTCGEECWSHKKSYRDWQSIGCPVKCEECCGGMNQIIKDSISYE